MPLHHRTLCFATVLLAATLPVAASPDAARLIVPGRSIGHLHLGPGGAAELRRLPRSDAGDAGMSQTEKVWVSRKPTDGRHDTLFVHTVSNGALTVTPLDGVTIDEIRVTSPWFHTRNGVSTGDTRARVRRLYPHLRRVSPGLYDDVSQGIGFEFGRQGDSPVRCIAITVHTPGEKHGTTSEQIRSLLREGNP